MKHIKKFDLFKINEEVTFNRDYLPAHLKKDLEESPKDIQDKFAKFEDELNKLSEKEKEDFLGTEDQKDMAMKFHGRNKTIYDFIMNGNSYLSHLKK